MIFTDRLNNHNMLEQISHYALYSESPSSADPELVHIETIHSRATLFDWTINVHNHPNMYQLIFILDGGAVVQLDGQQSMQEAPCVICIPAGVVHGFEFAKGTVGQVVTVSQLVVQDEQFQQRFPFRELVFNQPHILPLPAAGEDWSYINATLQALASEYDQQQLGKQAMFAWLLFGLMIKLGRLLQLQPSLKPNLSGYQLRHQQLMELIEQHYREHWTAKEYAQALHTTTMSLSRTCQALGSKSVNDLLQDRLLLEAQRMLIYTSATSSKVAYELGFKDPAYFSRFFKRRTGLSPKAFRASREA